MITIPEHSQLLSEIQSRYGVGPRYAQAYLLPWLGGGEKTFHSLKDILDLPPPRPMWFEYAMSTNWRGQAVSELLASYMPKTAHRYLDVGCGFGGFLVAFAKLGMEVYGVEIDPQRIQLAEANCLDHDLKDCVLADNILDEALVNRLGRFDVITCIDVIEHVLDVPKALLHMTGMLNPGGILMLEIPNKHSLSFVARDGHFELFGITLLNRNDAIEYHKAFFNFEYDVGDYYEIDFYRHEIEKCGCHFELIGAIRTPRDFLSRMVASYKRYRVEQYPKLPFSLRAKIRSRFVRFLFMLAGDGLRQVWSKAGRIALRRKYLSDFWRVLVTKGPSK